MCRAFADVETGGNLRHNLSAKHLKECLPYVIALYLGMLGIEKSDCRKE